jgi:DNA-directed RNA polymerase subunit omega
MARVSIEDCLEKIHNRFDLVLLAAERTKQIMKAKDNKEVVTALREVAAGKVRMARPKAAVEGEAVEGKLPEA